MLTPQEVSERAFPKASFGGYNMTQVDEFLDVLTEDYSALYSENAVLKKQNEGAGGEGGGVPLHRGGYAEGPDDRPAHGG